MPRRVKDFTELELYCMAELIAMNDVPLPELLKEIDDEIAEREGVESPSE